MSLQEAEELTQLCILSRCVCSESALNRQFPSPNTILTFRLICSRNGSISSFGFCLQVDLGVPLQEFLVKAKWMGLDCSNPNFGE